MAGIRVFTTVLERFLSELTAAFPDDAKLHFYGGTIRTFLQMQPAMVHRYFLQYVSPLRDRVDKRDESLWTDDLGKMAGGNEVAPENLLEALRIRDLWHVMTDNIKDNVWKYLSLLFQASDRV